MSASTFGKLLVQDRVEQLRQRNFTYLQIAAHLGLSKKSVEMAVRRLIKSGRITRKTFWKHNLHEAFFDTWTPELAYFLGLFASDGSMSNYNGCKVCIELNAKNDERKILTILAHHIGIPKVYKIKRSGAGKGNLVKLAISRRQVFEKMLRFGFTSNKTYSLHFPFIPRSLISHFVRGFLMVTVVFIEAV
jgi:hypothetical protein